MFEWMILWDWLAFAVRWLHVITAIAWIGSSFYFIALDLGLRPSTDRRQGVTGEEWQVHGGGFYFIQKYATAPSRMPEDLTWFKWESYSTWLSGAALLMMVYWVGGELFLIDPTKADLVLWQGIAISAASIAVGWLLYDFLCKSKLGDYPTAMMFVLFLIILVMSWGLNQVFTGRAALLHLGAFTATIMTANVFFIIIPNQTVVVADLKADKAPDPKYGKIAKLRSTHNNYLTLPVIFLMLSNHYPLAFATEYAWIIASLVFLMGVSIRHYFNTIHARKGRPNWTWGVTALIFAAIIALSMAPGMDSYEESEARALTPFEEKYAASAHFEDAYYAVVGSCSMCHAREPGWDGIRVAPKGVVLETEADVARHAKQIYLQAGLTHAMPPPGAFEMDPEFREQIVTWFRDVNGVTSGG